jgi:hypothetical protein
MPWPPWPRLAEVGIPAVIAACNPELETAAQLMPAFFAERSAARADRLPSRSAA